MVASTPDTTLLDIGYIRHELFQLLRMHEDALTAYALPHSFRLKVIQEVHSYEARLAA